ncbi:MAG: alpha/beta hydrolase [Rhodospirillaceae bacterium]|nr:alpha/beta hydrolase [Rhodospirillaceae bacterium]
MVKKIAVCFLALIVLAYAGLVGYAYWPVGGPGVPAKSLAAADDKFIDVNGLSIRYKTYGEPGEGRPNLVLMHGFGNSLQSFRNLAPLMAECCSVVAFDFPGYGLSAKPVAYDYSNAGQAVTAIAFAKAMNIDKPVYVGHSMGGAIALHTGVKDPNAAGVVFIDPGIFETGVPKVMAMAPFPLPRMSAKLFGNREWRGQFMKVSFVDPSVITDAVMDDLSRTARTDDYWSGTTAMMSNFTQGQEEPLLPLVKVPVVAIFGESSRNHPDADRKRLQAAIPGSGLVVIAKAGHYPHEEQAAETAAAITQALAEWGLLTAKP